jgi:hypothetical protein
VKNSKLVVVGGVAVLAVVLASVVAASAQSSDGDGRAHTVTAEQYAAVQQQSAPTREQLPDCVSVGAGGVNQGCVRKTDLGAEPDEKRKLLDAGPGLPVYESGDSSTQTGYLTPAGFVPMGLVDRYSEIVACQEAFSARIAGGSPLSESCHDLLLAQGTNPSVLQSVENGTGGPGRVQP